MRPVLMPRIAALRKVPAPSDCSPDEWPAATVHVAGPPGRPSSDRPAI